MDVDIDIETDIDMCIDCILGKITPNVSGSK